MKPIILAVMFFAGWMAGCLYKDSGMASNIDSSFGLRDPFEDHLYNQWMSNPDVQAWRGMMEANSDEIHANMHKDFEAWERVIKYPVKFEIQKTQDRGTYTITITDKDSNQVCVWLRGDGTIDNIEDDGNIIREDKEFRDDIKAMVSGQTPNGATHSGTFPVYYEGKPVETGTYWETEP
jgi:hypothetical protein